MAGGRAPIQSFGGEQSTGSISTLAGVGDATGAATLVWKPGVAELPDKTGSRASWSQTGRGAAARQQRPGVLAAIGLAVLAVGLGLVGAWRVLAGPSGPPVVAGMEASAAPLPGPSAVASVASAPVVQPAPPASDAPVAAASATAKAAIKTKPVVAVAVAVAAPRSSATAPTPAVVPAPRAPSTSDTFGGGRY
jgi:hypothetical protein